MAYQKRVYAEIFSRRRGAISGTLDFVVDFVIVTGDMRSGKALFTVTNLASETKVQKSLRDQLIDHLNVTYTPDVFTDRDILGLTV